MTGLSGLTDDIRCSNFFNALGVRFQLGFNLGKSTRMKFPMVLGSMHFLGAGEADLKTSQPRLKPKKKVPYGKDFRFVF